MEQTPNRKAPVRRKDVVGRRENATILNRVSNHKSTEFLNIYCSTRKSGYPVLLKPLELRASGPTRFENLSARPCFYRPRADGPTVLIFSERLSKALIIHFSHE